MLPRKAGKKMTKYVLSVDPGKATGMALFSLQTGQEPVLEWSGEFQQHEYAEPIRAVLSNSEISENLTVVCERFTINAQTLRNSQSPFSLEQIGILKQCILDAGKKPEEIVFQAPADAKAMFPNEALKFLEYWHRGGEGHALDAIRHALLRLVKLGWKPVKLLER
jgi:hypothetical protein